MQPYYCNDHFEIIIVIIIVMIILKFNTDLTGLLSKVTHSRWQVNMDATGLPRVPVRPSRLIIHNVTYYAPGCDNK